MNDSEKIEKLKEIIERDSLVDIDNVNRGFRYGSLNEYILNRNLYKDAPIDDMVITSRYNTIMNAIEKIKEITKDKETFLINNEPQRYALSEARNIIVHKDRLIDTMHYFAEDYSFNELSGIVDRVTFDWRNMSEKLDIDISKNLRNINEYINDLEGLSSLNNLYTEVDTILEDLEKLSETFDNQKDEGLLLDFQRMLNNQELINKPEFRDIESLFKHFKVAETFEKIQNEVNIMLDKALNNQKDVALTDAHRFILDNNKNENNDLMSFIKRKAQDCQITFEYSPDNTSKYKSFVQFKDESCLIKFKDDKYKHLKSNKEAKECLEEIFNGVIKHKLRKSPKIAESFVKLLKKDLTHFNFALIAMDTYLNNVNVLKANNFNLIEAAKGSSFEYLDDDMNKAIKEQKIIQYAHSIVSKKYRDLYDKNTYKIIKEIYDLDVPKEKLQELFGKKLAAYKTTEDLNNGLTKLLDSFNNFDFETILEKTKNNNATLISSEDNIIIVKIDNFNQSKALGSNSWCISRDKQYFDSYTNNNKNQYFIYNLNKNSIDTESIIGLTLKSDGSYYTAHKKNDDSFSRNDYIKELQIKILNNQKELYKEIHPELRELIAEGNNTNINKQLNKPH